MYPESHELKKYTRVDALLVGGLSTVLLVVGDIFAQYGILINNWTPIILFDFTQLRQILFPPRFLVVELVSYILGINYFKAANIVWILGVLLMIGGLMGYASLLRFSIFKLLKRKH